MVGILFTLQTKEVKNFLCFCTFPGKQQHSNITKGGEIRDTKTLNLSRNIVSLQVFVDVSRFFTLRDQPYPQQKTFVAG